MVPLAFLLAAVAAEALGPISPVPGGCTAPAADNRGRPGCFLSAELPIVPETDMLYWHVVEMPEEGAAVRLAQGLPGAVALLAHDRWWVHLLNADPVERGLPAHHVAASFAVEAGRPLVARLIESWFPPGMRTRPHAHSGPEAFYVIDGVQCTETPAERRMIAAGESYTVAGGPHLQAAPQGRRSLVVILAPAGEPWMRLTDGWSGTGFCD